MDVPRPVAALSPVFSVVQVAVLGALVLVPSAVIVRTEWELRERLDTVQRDLEGVRAEAGKIDDLEQKLATADAGRRRKETHGGCQAERALRPKQHHP